MTSDIILERICKSQIIPRVVKTATRGYIDDYTIDDITQDVLVECCEKSDKLLEIYENDKMDGVYGYVVEMIRLDLRANGRIRRYLGRKDVTVDYVVDGAALEQCDMEDEMDSLIGRLPVIDAYILRTYLEYDCDIMETAKHMGTNGKELRAVLYKIHEKLKGL